MHVQVLFFYIWIFLSVMILLNIFVGILMDGYAEAKDEGQAQADRAGLEAPDAVYEDVMTAVRKTQKELQLSTSLQIGSSFKPQVRHVI